MKRGTKSILFGVHAFWWHWWVVGRAWKKLFRRWPTAEEWLAIGLHDIGYWGLPDIDGPEGRLHPERGARIAVKVAKFLGLDAWAVGQMILGHSREYVKRHGGAVSELCWPDKLSVIFEPDWFYLLRSGLSGELREFVDNAKKSGHIPKDATGRQWLRNYRARVITNKEILSRNQKHEKTPLPVPRVVRGDCACGV